MLWDLKLLFYTLKIIFIRESTEGVDQTQPGTAAGAAEPAEADQTDAEVTSVR